MRIVSIANLVASQGTMLKYIYIYAFQMAMEEITSFNPKGWPKW